MSDRIEQAIEAGVDAIRQRFPGLDMAHLEFGVGLEAALAALVRCDCGTADGASWKSGGIDMRERCPDHRPHVVLAERSHVEQVPHGADNEGDMSTVRRVVVLESTNVVVPNGRIPTIMAIPVPCIVARLDDG